MSEKISIFLGRFFGPFSIMGLGGRCAQREMAGEGRGRSAARAMGAIMADERDSRPQAAVQRTVVLGGLVYQVDVRHVMGGWFASWQCDACHAIGAASGTHRTAEMALFAAKRNLKFHQRDSHLSDGKL